MREEWKEQRTVMSSHGRKGGTEVEQTLAKKLWIPFWRRTTETDPPEDFPNVAKMKAKNDKGVGNVSLYILFVSNDPI